MKPGIYHHMPFSEYAEAPGLNQSKLKVMRRSPKKFKHMLNVSKTDTLELGMGRAIHTAVLEPETFNDCYAQLPEVNLRTNDGKKLIQDFKNMNPGKDFLKASEYTEVFEIAASVLGDPDAARLLADTERELSVWWKDEGTDVLCKARIDAWLPKARTIIDLKTTRDAGPAFARGIWQYGYHLQAAWYMQALEAHGLMPAHFIFIAVEKEPPYDVGIYRLTDEVIQLSRQENSALLRKYAECERKDYWPGYTEGIVDIGIPKFGYQELEEQHGIESV